MLEYIFRCISTCNNYSLIHIKHWENYAWKHSGKIAENALVNLLNEKAPISPNLGQ